MYNKPASRKRNHRVGKTIKNNMEQTSTFEQIDAHINAADLAAYKTGGTKHFSASLAATDPGGVLTKICGIYHVIKPILQGVLLIPFIPAKWKEAIRTFTGLMDTLCP